ncbi:MAG TPA: MBL fold metallo-hydrolase [Ktedonobacterales bacterium]|nr:MBL fold metallo-hydrolase [Ktedonobacterales bacterium]
MAALSDQNEAYISPYFTLHTLADGVYAAIITPGTGAYGNAGIVDLGDATLVFDTFFTLQAAQSLRVAAERLTGRRVTYVVNSHYNSDHIHGNQVFTDAVVISTIGSRDLIATRGVKILAEMKAHPESEEIAAQLAQAQDERTRRSLEIDLGEARALEASLPALELRLPSVLFERRLVIEGSRRRVELLSLGGGHTDSDVFLLVSDAKVAFLGDLLFTKSHPSIWTERPDGWIDILSQIERMDIATAVPGHGPLGTLADVATLRQYWEEMRTLADSLVRSGATAEDIAQTPIPARYTDWQWPEGYTQTLQKLAQDD